METAHPKSFLIPGVPVDRDHLLQLPGIGLVTFSRDGERTQVTRAFARSPLRLLQPRNHGRAAWVFTSSYGGGLVSGDTIDLRVKVEPGAAGLLSTQASTKVYRSKGAKIPHGPASGCAQHLHAEVAEGALLVLAPDPVVCFAQARFAQKQRIELAAQGSLVLIDAVTSGRHGSGERWAFCSYESLIEIYCAGTKRVHESLRLATTDGSIAARMGRMNVLVFLALLGPQVRGMLPALRADLAGLQSERRGELLATCSALGSAAPPGELDGLIVRIGASSVERATNFLRQRLRILPELLGDDLWARKW